MVLSMEPLAELSTHLWLRRKRHCWIWSIYIIAQLQRAYPKGRDSYNGAWSLSQPGWPDPNPVMLQSALVAADQQRTPNAEINWCQRPLDRLLLTNWDHIAAHVAPFIVDDSLAIMDRELIRQQFEKCCAG